MDILLTQLVYSTDLAQNGFKTTSSGLVSKVHAVFE